MATRCVTARVSGRVQGVWFRAWTRERAQALGLTGWVRNEADGSVSTLICGPDDAVGQMLDDLHTGPDLARVTGIDTTPADPADTPGEFVVLG